MGNQKKVKEAYAAKHACRGIFVRGSIRINYWYLWRPRGVQSRSSGGQPHTGTGGMSWWRSFQTADDDGGLGFGGQQSPHRSEVFWEGLFLVLNARPPMGTDGHRFSPNSPSVLLLCCCFSFLLEILLRLWHWYRSCRSVQFFTWNTSSWILLGTYTRFFQNKKKARQMWQWRTNFFFRPIWSARRATE